MELRLLPGLCGVFTTALLVYQFLMSVERQSWHKQEDIYDEPDKSVEKKGVPCSQCDRCVCLEEPRGKPMADRMGRGSRQGSGEVVVRGGWYDCGERGTGS